VEARYELNQTVRYDVLNQLRARAGMPDFVVHPQSADPQHGDYGYAVGPSLQADGLIDYFSNQLPMGYRFRVSQDYLDDIPQVELMLNPNLQQNPGWQ